MMKLFVHTANRTIHAASNLGAWQVPEGFEVVAVPGDAETFAWPNGHPTRCKLDAANSIVANPAWIAPADPYAFRTAVPSIFSGTDAQKLERMFALRLRVPGLTEPFLRAIEGPDLNAEEAAWVGRIADEVKARIGLAGEVLTQAEYDAMKALAARYGMGPLFS